MRPAYQPTYVETTRGYDRGIMPNDTPDMHDYPEMTMIHDQLVSRNKVEILMYALVDTRNVPRVLRQWQQEMVRYERVLGPPSDALSRHSNASPMEEDSDSEASTKLSKSQKRRLKHKKMLLEAAQKLQEPEPEEKFTKEQMILFAQEFAKSVKSKEGDEAKPSDTAKPAEEPQAEVEQPAAKSTVKRPPQTSAASRPNKKKKPSKHKSSKPKPQTQSKEKSASSVQEPRDELDDLLQDGPQPSAPKDPTPLVAKPLPDPFPAYGSGEAGQATEAASDQPPLGEQQQQRQFPTAPQAPPSRARHESMRLPYQPEDVVLAQPSASDWGTQEQQHQQPAPAGYPQQLRSDPAGDGSTGTTSQANYDLLNGWSEDMEPPEPSAGMEAS